MYRLRRFIVLVIVGVLGLQTAAMALHTHFMEAPAAIQAMADDHHAHHGDQHAGQDAQSTGSHHSASCAAAQSCFPPAHAVGMAPLTVAMSPVVPAPGVNPALPSPRPEALLRPPRQLV